MRSINPKATILALFLGLLMFSNQLLANVNVLIIGCSKDSGEQHHSGVSWNAQKPAFTPNSKAFSPTAIGTELQSILAQDGRGTVNVTVLDRYRTDAIAELAGWSAHSYTLAGWFHYPYPAGAETARWANLRGESGTVWDYIVLIGDPYTMEYTPGMYAHGVAKIAEEVAKSANPAQIVLLMPWPGSGSSSTVNHYKEVVYRAGRSGGHKVAPAALAWQACGSPTTTGSHPNAAGSYIAAASIYSSIYNQSAAASGYVSSDANANTTFTTYTNNNSASHYTGNITFQNPYKILDDKKRGIRMSERGTSTEDGFKGKLKPAMDRCKVTYAEYNDGTYTNNIPPAWATSPLPIDFNYGRDGFYSEAVKSYLANPTYWQAGFGYYYQNNTFSLAVETANDVHIGLMQEQDNDLANRMINEAPVARNIPTRSIWAQIHKEYPTLNPLRDGSGPHLSYNLDEAVGTYIYTLFSGRCPLDPKPATDDIVWTCRKIGYETAWRLGRCQSRAPGFKVTPSLASKKSITPGEKETMTVQFIFPPTQNVTVDVSISNANAAVVGSKQLVFTPQNYNVPQNVTVAGLAGSAASDTFNVVFSTTSTDEVCNGLSDTWDYTITRSAPVTLSRVNKTTNLVTAYQNLPVTINLNTATATSANTVLAGPSRGTAVWSGSNVIYTPSSDFLGKDGFSFATNDGSSLSVGYVEITVTTAAVNGMVSYRGNGSDSGTVPFDSATYAQNATVTVLGNTGNLFRSGYNFAGWNTAANGTGTNYAGGATFTMGASGMILYAKWTAVPTYTVTYNGNSNTSGSVPFNQTKTDGVNLTLATNIGTLARTNYTFAGWNTAANGTGTDYVAGGTYSGNSNVTLYAKWTPNNYTVTFNANGGGAPSPATKSVTYGSTYGALATVSYAGFSFNGWFTAASGGTQILPTTNVTITAAQTLYAQWTAITSYTVSYNANGATSGTVPVDQTKQIDVPLTLATNTGSLARTSYTFAGWNTAADGTGTPYAVGASYTANAAVILYAQWAGAATYTVNYLGNGNTGGTAPSNQTKNQGVALALATNSGNLTKTGSSFMGWNTAANGGGTAYAVGATYTADAPLTLYAQWNALPVVNAGADQAVTLGAAVPWLPTALSPQLWLDASTATNNAGTVSITNTGSGGGTVSGPAALAAAGIGTLQAVQFNAASKYLTGDYTNIGTTLSAFFVGKSLNATQTAYAGMMSVWANGQASDWNNAGSSVLFNQNNATANSVQTYRNAALSSTTGTLTAGFLAATVYDGATNTAYLNGTAATGVASSGAFNAGKVVLGARWQTSAFNNWWNGNFGEAIICNANLNATDRQKVEGYLAHKWGLAGSLPAGHPHKATAPGGSGAVATLDGTATDTDAMTYAWSFVSGPASVTFANAAAIDTTATFTVAGSYTLRLTVNDVYGSSSDDIVITVNAAGSTHAVTYDGNGSTGGSVPTDASSPYTNGATVTVLGNTGALVRTGYTFNNWNTAANGSGTSYAPAATFSISTPTTLYAQWTPDTYAVTYNANSATSGTAPANQTKTHNVSLTLQTNSGTLARAGYTFSGWNTLANGMGTDYAVGANYIANAGLALFAKWTPNTYAVTYDANFATSGTAPANQTKTQDVNLTLQTNTGTLARTGYTFSGWNTLANGAGTDYAVGATYTANASLTLYAKWTAAFYTVSYNANSATSGTAPANQSKTHDVSLTLQTNSGSLARTGYTFSGWNTLANGTGTDYAAGASYTANAALILYAKWTINTYAVTYNANSATSGTAPANQTKTHDVNLTLQSNSGTLARTGYAFSGWNTLANGTGTDYAVGASYTANAALTLFAKWTLNTYAVTYDANAATSGTAPANQTKTHDVNLPLQTNSGSLARTGYTFSGWNTLANGTGVDYAAGATYTGNAALTLFAKWTPNTYAVTYNVNLATSGTAPANQTKTHDVNLPLQTNSGSLARTGYTFSGWNTLANGTGTDYAAGASYATNAALTLFAKWTINTYAVTYDANSASSGTAPAAQSKTHDVNLTLQTNSGSLARTGYTFSGWNTLANGTGTDYVVGASYTANAALALYAKWTPNTYAVTYNANLATSGTAPANQSKIHDVSLTLQINSGSLARTGYTFGGWNTLANGTGTDYAAGASYTANAALILFAKWTPNTYAVTYNANLATSGTAPANQTKTYSVDLTLQTNSGTLVRTNYTFSGWNTLADGTGIDYAAGSTYTNNAALSLYAKWTPNTYAVTYNANLATSGTVPANQNKTYGVNLTLQTNSGSLARTGYTFGGWNTLADGTGTDHAAGSIYTNDAVLTLYAKWISGTFLTWDANGGVANQTDGAGEWTNANQWWNGSANAAWSSSANAIFGNGGAGGAVGLASPVIANSLTFNSFTGTYTLGTAAQSLTINGGIQKTATSGIVSISSPVVIAANQTWTNNSSSGLTASSTVNNGGFTITVDGTGTTNMTGVISGSGGFVKNGSGRLSFGASANPNTYTGPTTINGGILSMANNTASLGSGNLTLNGGVLGFYWSAGLTRALGTGNNEVSIPGGESGFGGDGGSGPTVNLGTTVVWGGAGQGTATGHFNPSKFVLGSADTTNAGQTTFSTGIDMNGTTRTIVVPKGLTVGGNVSTISGAITSTGAAGLIKEGGGTLILSAVNTFTGNTTISEGVLRIGNNTSGTLNSGNYAGNISIASGATLQIWSSAAQTLSGIISGAGGLHKAYGSTLTLSGPNTYTGRTSIIPQNTAGCTVNITSFNSVNGGTPLLASSSLGAPTMIANGTIDIGSGTAQAGVNLSYTGPGETTDRVINFSFNGGASHTLTASGSGLLKFTNPMTSNATTQIGSLILRGTGSGEITQALPALPTGGLAKNDGGTWTLGGANSYTGPTAVTAGKLFINGNQSLATGNVTVSANATLGGTGTLGGNTTIAASGKLEFNLSTAAVSHDKLDLAATRALVFSGASTLTITSTGGASTGSYTLLTAPGGITGVAPATLNLPVGWAATVSISGNDLVLNVTSTGSTYTVTYDSNSATSGTAPSNQTKNHNVSLTLAFNTGALARTGYTFAGWNTQSDGTGTTYAEGASYTTNAALTLYAKWTMLPFTSWAASSGLSGGNAASTANPDGDNLTNLQEFAFGMNPQSPALAPISYVANGTTNGGTPILEKPGATYRAVFARRKDHIAAGLTYTVTFSADLIRWTENTLDPIPVRRSGDNADTMEAVSIDFPTTVPLQTTGSAAPQFFRVTVSGN